MPIVLGTGMSGTGKSTALTELGRRGQRIVDTDERGCGARQEGVPRPVRRGVLLSAPVDVILGRIRPRSTHGFRGRGCERERILGDVIAVEPLLRTGCTHEIDATKPIEQVVDELEEIAAALGP